MNSEFNANPWLLNLQNGILDCRTRVLTPHTPDFLSTRRFHVCYREDAPAPARWLEFLLEVMEGEEDVICLQQFLGACLSAGVDWLEKCVVLYGSGANGKSVLLNTIEKIFSKSTVSRLSLEQISDPKLVHRLQHKLINISTETKVGSKTSDDIFKQVTSCEEMEADIKYRSPVKFRSTAKLIFAANNLPRFADRSHALERRLIILNFPREFSEAEKDYSLSGTLAAELDGIFNWMLDGLEMVLHAKRIDIPKNVADNVDSFMYANDPVAQFVGECLKITGDAQDCEPSGVVYAVYAKWCEQNGYAKTAKERFTGDLRRVIGKRQIGTARKRGVNGSIERSRVITGIKITDEANDEYLLGSGKMTRW